ncbi:hypothetical protein CDD82_2663 [Ophiocordyceps australis]|uniref:Arginine biosynthesis bifunctional protein ArgJ, mitochondrial n=1 Tax=Ophiocordyceps australis TaxID=1399860 RepID=A0A2C5ZWM7_9HYPO|nr:hypothetical protein CDD82_2663 [Ophiocordyceps australis]
MTSTRTLLPKISTGVPLNKAKYVPKSGVYPKGFAASGMWIGVKPSNLTELDLAVITSDRPCSAAAVFTKNKFQAAPVTFSRRVLQKNAGAGFRSIVINAGCANAVTGMGGLEDAASMAKVTDQQAGSPDSTLVMSTGVIGQRLPINKILDHIPTAWKNARSSHKDWLQCATAICTTDTFPKLISRSFGLPSSPGVEYRIAGMTKGAGMLAPNLATLLGIMATDAPVAPGAMAPLLKHAVDRSFNSIIIDGDTSTNDTVALLANGAAGGSEVTLNSPDYTALCDVVSDFATDLAKYIVRDGEGATKFVTVRVVDCASEKSARAVARAISLSPLVKTALHGQDANWGRILCAAGYSLITPPGEPINNVPEIVPERTNVSFIPTDGSAELKLLVNGEPEAVNEARATDILKAEDLEILVKLGTGDKSATIWTCDFSHDYVSINGDYRT